MPQILGPLDAWQKLVMSSVRSLGHTDVAMSERIHDEEPDTSEAVVRMLLSAECPQWADLPMSYVRGSGTDNAMWRVDTDDGPDVVVRLPRGPSAAPRVPDEIAILANLTGVDLAGVATPQVLQVGEPHELFPYPWVVLSWLPGDDAWTARHRLTGSLDDLAIDLAAAVTAIGSLKGVPAPTREPGHRGGPLEPMVSATRRHWLDDPRWNAEVWMDVTAVERLLAEGLEADAPHEGRFVHGDLIPGNLLVEEGRLSAILDWGMAGYGDPAQDLAPAWAVLDGSSRDRFRDAVGADDATWIRARTIELAHAIAGVVYYKPRGHTLGDVMERTLNRILADS